MQRAVSWHEEMTSSVLSSLKDTFHSVQEDISASFHKIKDTKLTSRLYQSNITDSCDLNAGDELLNKYQQNWCDIHNDITETAKQAELVDALTLDLFTRCESQWRQVDSLHSQVLSLPDVLRSLDAASHQIGELHGMFDDMEGQLHDLEDVIEQFELQELQINHRLQLASYREKKRADVQILSDELSQQYLATIRDRERRQQELQREKSKVYGESFRQDIINYQQAATAAAVTGDTTGETSTGGGEGGRRSREVSVSCSESDQQQRVTLDDVTIECDQSELNEFLDDDDPTVGEFDGKDSKLHVSVSPVVTPSSGDSKPVAITPSPTSGNT